MVPFWCPALGRFEKLLNSMNSSVFLVRAACVAETKQNHQTDTEKEFRVWLNFYAMKVRGKGTPFQSQPQGKVLLREGLTH